MPAIGYATFMSNPPLSLRATGRCERLAHCQPFGFNAELSRAGIKLQNDLLIEVGTISCPAHSCRTISTDKVGAERLSREAQRLRLECWASAA